MALTEPDGGYVMPTVGERGVRFGSRQAEWEAHQAQVAEFECERLLRVL